MLRVATWLSPTFLYLSPTLLYLSPSFLYLEPPCLFLYVKGGTKSILHAEYTLQMVSWVFRLYGHVLNTTSYSLVSLAVELEQDCPPEKLLWFNKILPVGMGGDCSAQSKRSIQQRERIQRELHL